MANIANRSPWEVRLPKSPAQKFRLKSQAIAHLASLGYDPQKLPQRAMRQLESAFEVQIVRKDSKGVEVRRSGTFDTEDDARQWARSEETALQEILDTQGGFNAGFETITVKAVLETFYHEHYKDKRSYNEIGYRIPRLIEWLGPNKLFRLLKKSDMLALKRKLKSEYSASSVRNFFTILTTLYTYVEEEWQYPVINIAQGLKLPKPKNAVQRDWIGDEQDRLMKSLAKRSPWLIPIVELALEMAFRRGELVQAPVRMPKVPVQGTQAITKSAEFADGDRKSSKKVKVMRGGLKWENINWVSEELRLPEEKNDHTKASTEFLGREVPITPRMREVLMPLYQASATKKGLVFSATINSVSNSFRIACQKAEPPIENLTFHSLRKIATKSLSRRVTNPMELGKLSGHKSIQVLNDRYYKATTAQLAALLKKSSGSIHDRGVAALTTVLGPTDAMKFVLEIRALADPADALK